MSGDTKLEMNVQRPENSVWWADPWTNLQMKKQKRVNL